MRHLTILFTAALMLQGCVAGSPSAPAQPIATARVTSRPPAPDGVAPKEETTLYLDVVDGLIKQKRYGAATAFLDGYAAKRRDFEPRYWLLRGEAFLGLNRPDEAMRAYAALAGTALAAEGSNGEGKVSAARLQWRDAAANFQEAVQGEPANPDFLNNLAFADMHLGRADASASYLRQAWELKPDSSLIRNNLLIALSLTGDREGADTVLKNVKNEDEREAVRTLISDALNDPNLTKDGT
jgi:tetratricopeptide (TPR) repeat protein